MRAGFASAAGDNDPVDSIEISLPPARAPLPLGSVHSVKVLGAFALIDQNETDWKVLTLREDHELAKQIHGERLDCVHFLSHNVTSVPLVSCGFLASFCATCACWCVRACSNL